MHNCAAIQNKNLVGERQHFIQVFANEQDCLAIATSLIQQLMHCLYCANVETARRRTHHEHSGIRACRKDFASKEHLLGITTGKLAGSSKRIWRFDFQLLDEGFSFCMSGFSIYQEPTITREHKVVDNRK